MATTRAKKKAAPRAAIRTQSRLAAFESQLIDHLATLRAFVMGQMRHRTLLVWIAPLLVLATLVVTDPDSPWHLTVPASGSFVWAIRLATSVVAIALAHWSMKAIFDYPEADRRTLFGEVLKGNLAAAGALIAQAITFVGILMLWAGQAHAEPLEITRARAYLPVLEHEVDRTWPAHPDRAILPGQISNETACPRKSTCNLPTARLKSAREEGAGFLQITRTWRADGSQRFDALAELRDRHPALLADFSWENVYQRQDLQLRAFVLKALDDNRTFAAVADPRERMLFGLVSHNRGTGGVQGERRACKLSPGCDPGKWFGNVEQHCTASRVALYGNRSACDISRAYPGDILVRAQRYRDLV